MINPGKYQAKIINYKLHEMANGHQNVIVEFEIENGEKISWFGGVSEKSMEYTLRDLMKMGATKDNFTKVAEGPASGVLDMSKILELVVDEYVAKNGETKTKVKYINIPGASKAVPITSNKLENFKGLAAQIQAETGQNTGVSKKMEDCPGF